MKNVEVYSLGIQYNHNIIELAYIVHSGKAGKSPLTNPYGDATGEKCTQVYNDTAFWETSPYLRHIQYTVVRVQHK